MGIDISKDPAILDSLYNLGKTASKAAADVGQGRKPRPNYFGFFVQQNLDLIGKTIDWTVPAAAAAGGVGARINITGHQLSRPLDLAEYPPVCDAAGPGNAGTYNKTVSLEHGRSVGTAQGSYRVVSLGMDCDLHKWTQIQTADGLIGWVDDQVLQSSSLIDTAPVISCRSQADAKCKAKMVADQGKDYLGDSPTGLQEIQLSGDSRSKSSAPDFKTFDISCLLAAPGATTTVSTPSKRLSAADYAALREKILAKRDEILKVQGIQADPNSQADPWDSSANIYKNIYVLNSYSLRKDQCDNGCTLSGEDDLKTLLNTDFSKLKGFAQFSKVQSLSVSFSALEKGAPDDHTRVATVTSDIDLFCPSVYKYVPDFKDLWSAAKPTFDQMALTQSWAFDTWSNFSKLCKFIWEIKNPPQGLSEAFAASPQTYRGGRLH